MMTTYLNRDDIIRMAKDVSGVEFPTLMDGVKIGMSMEHLERFAALVAAAEREKMKWDGIHTCHAECQHPICVAVREAVAAEREACAKVCQKYRDDWYRGNGRYEFMAEGADYCADAILARGQ